MAKKQTKWTDDMVKTVVDTVESFIAKGRTKKYGILRAARKLKVSKNAVSWQYFNYRAKNNTKEDPVEKPVVKKVKKGADITVKTIKTEGSFGMGAICEFGIVTLSKDLLTINFLEGSSIKMEQTANGMTISKA